MEYGSLKVKLSTHVLFKDFNDICHFGSGYEHVFTIIPMAAAFLHLAGGQYVLFFSQIIGYGRKQPLCKSEGRLCSVHINSSFSP